MSKTAARTWKEMTTETGCRVLVYEAREGDIGRAPGFYLILTMDDPEDTRTAEVQLTADEKHDLGMALLDPRPSTQFVPSKHWKEGERFIVEGYSGSYPDKSKDRLGTVIGFRETVHSHEHLVVRLDGEDKDHESFNSDIMRHLREGEGP